MLGVLIVDDDAIARMNLKSMIDWEKEGFYILGEAENGKTALDIILREKPEIVITDVKMPVMDGLQMIHEAGKEYDSARYVVLSSYEEFGLLKTAMSYGVTEYLLKLELTPSILKTTLEKQREFLLREKSQPSINNRVMSAAGKAAKFLRHVLAGYDASGELVSFLEQACPGIEPKKLSCIAIRFSPLNRENSFGNEDRRAIETAAESIINDITKSYFPGLSFLADTGLCLFVYSPKEGRAGEMCGVIIQMLRQYLNLAAAAGISSLEDSWEHINRIMIDAIRAAEELFFRGYGVIVYSAELEAESFERPSQTDYDWAEPYRQALELRQPDKVKKILQNLQGIMRRPSQGNSASSRISRSEAFNLCFSLAGITLSVLKKEPAENSFPSENLYETIGVIETLEGLREWIRSFQTKILNFFDLLQKKPHEDHIVLAAKRYIAENYRRSISLNGTAKALAISSGYLSSVFRRRTGTCFTDYLTKVKIDEAKNLLLSGQYKVYEISEMVGYNDNGYFIKIFHKITGMTPTEFIAKHI